MNNPLNMPSFFKTYALPLAFFAAWVVFTITMPGAILGFTGWQTLGLTGWSHAGIALITQTCLGVFQAVAEYTLHHYPESPDFEHHDVQLELEQCSAAVRELIGGDPNDTVTIDAKERFVSNCRMKFAQRNEILARNSLFAGILNTVVAAMGWLMMFHLGKIVQYASYGIAFAGWRTVARYLPSIFQGVSALVGVGVWWSIRSNRRSVQQQKGTYLQRWANGLKAIDAVYFAISFASGASFGALMRSTFSIGTLSARWLGILKVVRPEVLAARSVSLITLQGVYVTLMNAGYHLVRGLLPFEKLPFVGRVFDNRSSAFEQRRSIDCQNQAASMAVQASMRKTPMIGASEDPWVDHDTSHRQFGV